MTTSYTGSNRGKIFWNMDLIESACKRLGHQVEWRPVIMGEDLSKFDVIIAGITKLMSMTAFELRYGCLWAMTERPFILLSDDGHKLGNDLHTSFKPKYIWNYPTGEMLNNRVRVNQEAGLKFQDKIDSVIDALREKKLKMIQVAYDWGNHDLAKSIFWFMDLRLIDLTPLHFVYEQPLFPIVKSRKWVMASLTHQREWEFDPQIGLSWPVMNIGNTTDNPALKKRVTHEYLVESIYRPNWGCMTWPFLKKIAGTGVWRDRFHHAIQAGSVIWAQPDEMRPLGEAFLLTIPQIESLTNKQLAELAEYQKHVFESHQPSIDEALTKFEDLLHNHVNQPIQ